MYDPSLVERNMWAWQVADEQQNWQPHWDLSGPTFLFLAEISLDRGVPPPLKIYPAQGVRKENCVFFCFPIEPAPPALQKYRPFVLFFAVKIWGWYFVSFFFSQEPPTCVITCPRRPNWQALCSLTVKVVWYGKKGPSFVTMFCSLRKCLFPHHHCCRRRCSRWTGTLLVLKSQKRDGKVWSCYVACVWMAVWHAQLCLWLSHQKLFFLTRLWLFACPASIYFVFHSIKYHLWCA